MIVMAWEMFGGSALETRIMIRKVAICHTDKHNRPQGQTIYQINQHLSAMHWGAADCLRVRRLNAGLAADPNDG
jgi:hypothetical protein